MGPIIWKALERHGFKFKLL